MRPWHGLLKVLLAVTGVALFVGSPARAADAPGLIWVSSSDPRPNMIGRPFMIHIGHHGTTRSEMREVRLEIEGFVLNPGGTAGDRIGSVDYYTDELVFTGSPITTAG